MKVSLEKVAHTRSGDKGDAANIGVIAWRDDLYPVLLREVTAARVKDHFGKQCPWVHPMSTCSKNFIGLFKMSQKRRQ